SAPLSHILKLPTPALVLILSIGIGFSIPMGVKRGGLQGLTQFGSLSRNFITESLAKLALGLLLVGLGYGVYGAVGAISASVIAAYLGARVHFGDPSRDDADLSSLRFRTSLQEGTQ